MESMESIMAESSANLLFHGHHGFHMEGSWNGHGMVNSIWIPWPKFHMENTTIFVVKNSVKYEN